MKKNKQPKARPYQAGDKTKLATYLQKFSKGKFDPQTIKEKSPKELTAWLRRKGQKG